MSKEDEAKWDERYAAGAYAERPLPSAFLVEVLDEVLDDVPRGRALDVACGAGRNAIFLAARGFKVDAIDISSVGLERAREGAAAAGVSVNWVRQDLLLDPPLPANDYALIIVFRFVAPDLLRRLPEHLAPGACLVVEEHLLCETDVVGPRDPRFRVAPGELARAVPTLEIVRVFEGMTTDPDGERAALARMIARKPG